MRLVAAIDTSCVIALMHLNLWPQVSFLFSRLLIPKGVRTELFRRRSTKDLLRRLFREYTFLEPCDDYDRGAVDILLVERGRLGLRDRGEAEAVVQAGISGATVIVDDRWGRKMADRYSLEFHGTLWILRRLHDLALFDGSEVRAQFLNLRKAGVRIPRKEVNDFLAAIRQPPLK